jgi:hypothetical protein
LEKILQNLRKTGKHLLAEEKEKDFKKLEDEDLKLKDLKKQREEAKRRKNVIGKMFKGNDDNEIEELEKESEKRQNSLKKM